MSYQDPEKGSTNNSPNTATVDSDSIGFFPIPWYAYLAFGLYTVVFVAAVAFGIDSSTRAAEKDDATHFVAKYYITVLCVIFVAKCVIVPLYRLLMLERFRAAQRGEFHWSLSLRPMRIIYYKDPTFFAWYYNIYIVMHSWMSACFIILATIMFWPVLRGTDNPPSVVAILIVVVLMLLPVVVFLSRARAAAAGFLMDGMAGYGATGNNYSNNARGMSTYNNSSGAPPPAPPAYTA